ncbi:hypothetical protein [Bradyrhizobium prioriisuperbiae]|uniref:hypothetical protein n=1 Tax=Bradyrhizobium prioriisuperbiae TaxID=2854389 RepID=UPI0028E42F01|nr:hypothetical protein [Bradyrhizobium prioritasuperba]
MQFNWWGKSAIGPTSIIPTCFCLIFGFALLFGARSSEAADYAAGGGANTTAKRRRFAFTQECDNQCDNQKADCKLPAGKPNLIAQARLQRPRQRKVRRRLRPDRIELVLPFPLSVART